VAFSNVQDLSGTVLSTMAQLMQIITGALRARMPNCVLLTGEKVREHLQPDFGTLNVIMMLSSDLPSLASCYKMTKEA